MACIWLFLYFLTKILLISIYNLHIYTIYLDYKSRVFFNLLIILVIDFYIMLGFSSLM